MADQPRWDGAGQALARDRATFEAMFNALPIATVFVDLQGEIQLVNPAFTTLFGSPPADVIGKPLDLFYACLPHGQSGDLATPVDVAYRASDGGTFIGETAVTGVRNADGRLLGWLRLIRDITERKHADGLVAAHLARLAKKHRYEAIVSAVAHSVHQSTSLQAVLENAVEAMRTHIERIDAIEIFLREGEEAALKAQSGLPDWVIAQIQRLPSPQGYTWKVMREGQPRYCADVDQDAFIHPAGRAFGIKSYVSMPISAEGQTVGAININSLQKHAFDDDELRLLEILSAHLETAINNAQQAEALRRALAEVERLKNRLQAENVYLQEEITRTHHRGEIIGRSRILQEVLRRVAQVAPTDATVLIQGETGTGKELVARAAILARGPIVEIDDALEQRLPPSHQPLLGMNLQDVERAHILRVLADTHGIIEGPRGAARILGLHPNTLRFRLQKLGITLARRQR
jgi:PAS domain S-box-containing protein